VGEPKRILQSVAEAIDENAPMLSELDAVGGDGDHGMSMNLGARGAVAAVADLDDSDIGAFLDAVGKSLISGVGAAMGPLYGTALVRAGKIAAGKSTLDGPTVAAMLFAASEGIAIRGKAKLGDKTMLDALLPAAEAADTAARSGGSSADVIRAASEGAKRGAEGTSAMIATKGRAARLGERTRGHQDAGATSTYVMISAIAAAVSKSKISS
jgi:dihydroxyacetone kinase-like protein